MGLSRGLSRGHSSKVLAKLRHVVIKMKQATCTMSNACKRWGSARPLSGSDHSLAERVKGYGKGVKHALLRMLLPKQVDLNFLNSQTQYIY
jgi:hypothetical protein